MNNEQHACIFVNIMHEYEVGTDLLNVIYIIYCNVLFSYLLMPGLAGHHFRDLDADNYTD